MVAWNNAVIINTAAGYRAFMAQFPDSDLTATARKLEERLRNRPNFAPAVASARNAGTGRRTSALAGADLSLQRAAAAPQLKKVERCRPGASSRIRRRRVDRKPPRRASPMTMSWSFAVRRRAWCTSRRREV